MSYFIRHGSECSENEGIFVVAIVARVNPVPPPYADATKFSLGCLLSDFRDYHQNRPAMWSAFRRIFLPPAPLIPTPFHL